MHEKRETISQLRDKGHPVDRRDKYEDGQPSREQYSPKEERELLKRAVSVHRLIFCHFLPNDSMQRMIYITFYIILKVNLFTQSQTIIFS